MPVASWHPNLFDPQTTQPPRCKHCDTERRNLCRFDADWHDTPTTQRPRRPRGCLNRYDPATAQLPEGF